MVSHPVLAQLLYYNQLESSRSLPFLYTNCLEDNNSDPHLALTQLLYYNPLELYHILLFLNILIYLI